MRRCLIKFCTLLSVFCFVSTAPAETGLASIQTDKARYAPGEPVGFNIELGSSLPGLSLQISCFYLGELVDSQTITISGNPEKWIWNPPPTDYRGYLVQIRLDAGSTPQDTLTIAVDVSSDWTRFPRYGFLSKYPYLSQAAIQKTIDDLNRYHINGLQFYDWHYKHHQPLKGMPENPSDSWPDIANRTIYRATVSGYIDAAHATNMSVMAYNLLYGAYENAATDGVSDRWRLFSDRGHSDPDKHELPESWASDIYLMDPSNPGWQNYILSRMGDVFLALDFDGWHIDQLGDRGTRYDYNGEEVDLAENYGPFIQTAKDDLGKILVMNAVNQYGQGTIVAAPVDFLYTEVWSPNDSYTALVSLIRQNDTWSDGTKKTVLAAYMHKALSGGGPGWFHTPAVLLTDAVIFAAGGAHLELGEHMLANEYFPNDNLKMTDELRTRLVHYYDFLVAYQNLLRDGGEFNHEYLQSESGISIRNQARKGSLWSFSRDVGSRRIYHVINFIKTTSLGWRDDAGNQPEPDLLQNIPVSFKADQPVQSLWMASPDRFGGMPLSLPFDRQGETIHFTIPDLKYWDMVVADFISGSGIDVERQNPARHESISLSANYPNPFNPVTCLTFSLPEAADVLGAVIDLQGRHIRTLVQGRQPAGTQTLSWDSKNETGEHMPSGVYVIQLRTRQMVTVRKVVLLR